ncbi:endopeptidase [Leminorella grimontii]|uniref:Endopeptidase n=1 Tax=Leminorella grimontii TaxID=82981 RepID=A0AAV5MW72_9GAMM|nr:lysis protein [Leminorella grimontii]KFC95730.1 Rz family phage outer membrane lytic protein [Leminorella grimontii ATCC 33999 = DSM 5078]GKX54086.1 endopeptidase [Leminorella grimontii]VFS60111.1 Bacteriophage lysis protein [Leminorella grimontii]
MLTLAATAAFFILISAICYLWSVNGQLESDNTALTAELKAANGTIEKMNAAQRHAAELDKRVTEKLHASESENDRLRSELTAANKRLRIKAKCPATSTGSVVNDTAVELSQDAGRTVFDIRAEIIRDRAKIEYLQSYITNVCLSQ